MIGSVTVSLETIITILVGSGKLIYDVGTLLKDGVEHVKQKEGVSLINRCRYILHTLESVDSKYITTTRTQVLVQTIVNALNWANRYETMSVARRVLFHKTYKTAFQDYHSELSKYYVDFSMSVLLTGIFPSKNDSFDTLQDKEDNQWMNTSLEKVELSDTEK